MAVATFDRSWKTVVWERFNKTGKWCPYSARTSQLLEQSYRKHLNIVWLGDSDESLKIYSVNLKDFVQISENTATKSNVRRRLYDDFTTVMWQWQDDHKTIWNYYDVDVANFIEEAYQEGEKTVDLSKTFPRYPYEINFVNMSQKNKRTKHKRSIRRQQEDAYPVVKSTCSDSDSTENDNDIKMNRAESSEDIPGTNALMKQINTFFNKLKKNSTSSSSDDHELPENKKIKPSCSDSKFTQNENEVSGTKENSNIDSKDLNKGDISVALVDGKPWSHSWPPHTPDSKLKPVPGIKPLPKETSKKSKKKKGSTKDVPYAKIDVLNEYTQTLESVTTESDNQTCIICYEDLSSASAYNDDNSVVKLTLCPHIFHKACLQAMYDSGPKESYLQCPTCKTIHGEKCGIQPPGEMIYHVLPYSLPGHHDCDTIRIIYNISNGIQGPEHPSPGHHYSARGFPRHCYLPDNGMGRKILRLLIKAWQRRLIFTIGQSSTTGENNTVTWNEIHHKTEFGCNRRGHGYPDPNYFDNVLAELETHGITDD